MPPFNSSSVGILSKPPVVVAEKSPIAWMALMANSTAMATQEDGSNARPKCSGRGSWNMDADAMGEKSTMPKNRDTTYPIMIPINIEDNFQIPFP